MQKGNTLACSCNVGTSTKYMNRIKTRGPSNARPALLQLIAIACKTDGSVAAVSAVRVEPGVHYWQRADKSCVTVKEKR